jgi:hypothetical protein
MGSKARRYPRRCLRCDARWSSRIERPVRCKFCKSQYWDRPRMRAIYPRRPRSPVVAISEAVAAVPTASCAPTTR